MSILTANSEINRNIVTKNSSGIALLELPMAVRHVKVQAQLDSATLADGIITAEWDLDQPNVYLDTTSATNVLTTSFKANNIFLNTSDAFDVPAGDIIVTSNSIQYKPATAKSLEIGDALRFFDFQSGDSKLAKDLDGKVVYVTSIPTAGTYNIGGLKTEGITSTASCKVQIINGLSGANWYYDTTAKISSSAPVSSGRYKLEMNVPRIATIDSAKGYGSVTIFANSDCLKKKTRAKTFNIVGIDGTGITVEDPSNELKEFSYNATSYAYGYLNFQIGENPINSNSVNTWDYKKILSIDLNKF